MGGGGGGGCNCILMCSSYRWPQYKLKESCPLLCDDITPKRETICHHLAFDSDTPPGLCVESYIKKDLDLFGRYLRMTQGSDGIKELELLG